MTVEYRDSHWSFHTIVCPQFSLDCGMVLEKVVIAFSLVGNPRGPLIIVQGGVSADRHVSFSSVSGKVGWWDDFVGPKKSIDTNVYRILSVDYLNGQGATQVSINSAERQPFCPAVSTRDQAGLIHSVVDALNLGPVHAFVGASYGGMVALAYAQYFGDTLNSLIAISAADKPHPMATAWRSLQRRIIRLGCQSDRSAEALSIARGLAMTTYRSAGEFATRFKTQGCNHLEGRQYPIDGYLEHHGTLFAQRWQPDQFLRMSESLDDHEVCGERILCSVTLIGVESDTLVPPWQIHDFSTRIAGRTAVHMVESSFGHDAFLKEVSIIGCLLTETLSSPTNKAVYNDA